MGKAGAKFGAVLTMLNCVECGAVFEWMPKAKGRVAMYCSPLCSGRAGRKSQVTKKGKRCVTCGKATHKKYCSKACVSAASHEWGTCGDCGKEMFGHYLKKFCGECYAIRLNDRESCRRSRRRAVKAQTPQDKGITLRAVAARARNKCYICLTLVDWQSHPQSGPLYPTVEHVVPLSKGGGHVWGNVELAHRVCNGMKGVRLGG